MTENSTVQALHDSETVSEFLRHVAGLYSEVHALEIEVDNAQRMLAATRERLKWAKSTRSIERAAEDALNKHSDRDLTDEEFADLVEQIRNCL